MGAIFVCLLFLVTGRAFCQQGDQPMLPEQGTNLPGFVPDTLPQNGQNDQSGPGPESLIPSGTAGTSMVPPGTSISSPYESRIQDPYGATAGGLGETGAPEAWELPPFSAPDLLTGSLYQSGVNSLNPPQLLPSLIRQSVARTWEGREPGAGPQAYNLKIGDMKFQFGFGMGIEGNDNIFTTKTNRQADVILQPALQVSSALRLTDLNTIQLNLGIGYQAYMLHSDQNTMTLSPGSQIAFIIYTGDFRIQFHDQFSLEQDPISQPTLGNVANTGIFTNDIGSVVTWDLNKMILTLGYDHTNTISTQSNASYPNQSIDSFSSTTSFTLNSSVKAGMSSEIDITDYSQGTPSQQLSDSTQLKLGPFVQWRLTDVTSLQADVGYDGFFFGQGGAMAGTPSQSAQWYGDLTISQTLNPHISQSLAIGRQASSGLNASSEQIDFLRHSVAWRIVDKLGLGTVLYIGRTKDTGGTAPQETTQYGAGATLSWQLGSKITFSSQYQFIYETANTQGIGYTQNEVLFVFNYKF
ncbi:MAG TPA: hypothetical protein VG733_18140 [Chthoniobacteraceae bacterium]|nr:hypothetical protein [Chthoniobacteraceae bacterium]